jgi:hypothetical protein
LASDKTKLSQFSGDKVAWPVYLSIGNIASSIRRQPSSNAMILLGYIPSTKLTCFSNARRSDEQRALFHRCMENLLAPLQNAGRNGVEMLCPDGFTRWVFPLLAAYIADHPEQCLVACCKENHCVCCIVHPNERGNLEPSPLRDPEKTLQLLKNDLSQMPSPYLAKEFHKQGLKTIYPPFWASLPHANIFASFTPDLLHQIHKGVFYDHLYSWCKELIGEKEIDARWKAMTSYAGLKHFKNGVSCISQWTGNEYKEMERAFVGVVAGAMKPEAVQAARALMDFAMYAQYPIHTTETLNSMTKALETFHNLKDAFSSIRSHFNIPKLHAISHYTASIKAFGSTIGFNTELPERLHIEFAKKGYRHSNKKFYTHQMARWLSRQEAIRKQNCYLQWLGIFYSHGKRDKKPEKLQVHQQWFEVTKSPSYLMSQLPALLKTLVLLTLLPAYMNSSTRLFPLPHFLHLLSMTPLIFTDNATFYKSPALTQQIPPKIVFEQHP